MDPRVALRSLVLVRTTATVFDLNMGILHPKQLPFLLRYVTLSQRQQESGFILWSTEVTTIVAETK